MTKFDDDFKDWQFTSDGDALLSRQAYTKEQAKEMLKPAMGIYVDDLYIVHKWVHWHGGVYDSDEFRNAWWVQPEFSKGAKPIWYIAAADVYAAQRYETKHTVNTATSSSPDTTPEVEKNAPAAQLEGSDGK